MSDVVDPEAIKKLMPKTWPELDKFKKDMETIKDKVKKAKALKDMPGIHPIIRSQLVFLAKFGYIKETTEEIEYFRSEVLREMKTAKEQNIEKLKEEKFRAMYMEEVQKKADKPIPNET